MLGVALVECMTSQEMMLCLCMEFIYAMSVVFFDNFYFINIFKINVKKREFALITLLEGIANFIVIILIPVPYSRAIHYIISILIYKFAFKQSLEKSLLGETINALISVSIEVIFSKVCCMMYSDVISYIEGLNNLKYSITFKTFIILSKLIILTIIKFKNLNINIVDHFQKKNKTIILITSIAGLVIIFFTSIELLYFIGEFQYIHYLINLISVIFYFFISIKSIIRVNELETQDLKIHSLEIYNKTLGIMYDSIRGFKHDFGNFVIALDGYVKIEDMDGIKQMSKSVLAECQQINDMGGILDPKIVGNPALYSIITNKYYLAKEQGMNLSLEVMTDLEQYNEHSYEICRILGILLDNAIEAAKETESKIINVRILDDAKANRKLIIVENSYDNKDININTIFDKGYTTKLSGHGLGLWNIKSILMNNEDLNLFTTKGELFKQQIEIYTKIK